MCTIFGGWGKIDPQIIKQLGKHGEDRGRDGTNIKYYFKGSELRAALGNCRAAPTHEPAVTMLQPYDNYVHNGTIANDKELGNPDGYVDSQILPRVLNNYSFQDFCKGLSFLKGSFAIATYNEWFDEMYLAANYKPLHYWWPGPDFKTVYFSSMERHFRDIVPFGQRPAVLAPYSALNLSTRETFKLRRANSKRALIVASAGLDSVVCAAKLKDAGYDIKLLHFVYGCKAGTKESELIPLIAADLKCEYDIIEVPYEKMKGTSSIMAGGEVEEGAGMELAHEWVPARNLVFASLAAAYAEANGFNTIALGNNLEESGSHPDNEEQMTVLLNSVLDYAVSDGYELNIVSPLGNLMKKEIAKLADDLDAPLEHTWSCYNDGTEHCGICGPCLFRKEAFKRAGVYDKIDYAPCL